ncbi:hypothetical protein VPNG_01236 [Cytospora leucostoma]|uniref:Methyltransferase type 11 domain-containing protein n=1 Tax=Cytospora leucostoma TaxID=1230097 RepID=A0A423XKU7_9PEZI|nr:hypothetical protein VPNG_01236 [Cytospora leucostoma]
MNTALRRVRISPSARAAAPWTCRTYASQASGAPIFEVFNRRTKWMQKERAATNVEGSRQADYLKDEVAIRLCERLLDIKRHFPRVLDLGANTCNVARALTRENPDPDPARPISPPLAARITELVAADPSYAQLHRDADLPFNKDLAITRQVLADEESLPYGPGSFDLVLSSMSLHWINDLPGILTQINHILRPDCPFIGAMLGGDTLFELRTSLQLAEQERRGGLSPRVSPLADVRDVGGLMQRAGFKMLTVDIDDIVVDYPNTFELMQDLQLMGESNADGTLPATFRIIYMIGWHDSPDQPSPLPRGSGELNLKDILESK